MTGLSQQLPDCIVESTSTQGIDPDWVETMTFAWLAKQQV
jgi:anhydro-N-acetylmuramic acid kinase